MITFYHNETLVVAGGEAAGLTDWTLLHTLAAAAHRPTSECGLSRSGAAGHNLPWQAEPCHPRVLCLLHSVHHHNVAPQQSLHAHPRTALHRLAPRRTCTARQHVNRHEATESGAACVSACHWTPTAVNHAGRRHK